MAEREACERRVYRLATLLTGDPRAATRVITAVVDAQPDLSRLDSAHLDRLTALRSREIRDRRLEAPEVPGELAEALNALTRQQREAWVFHHVYRMMSRDMAKAMDCSVRAIQHHLVAAESIMNESLKGDVDDAARTLLRYSMRLDVPEFYRREVRRRSVVRRMVTIAIAVAIVAGLIAVVVWFDRSGVLEPLISPGGPGGGSAEPGGSE